MNRITHEDFMRKVTLLNPPFDVISEYQGYRNKITLKCKKDGHIWSTTPDCILNNGTGCPVCSNNVVVKGINSLLDTHPSVAKLLNNTTDGDKYSYGSHKKLEFKCPHCGNVSIHVLKDIVSYGYSCKKCGDNVSFPNKVMFNLLSQLHINFENEKVFNWGEHHKYDFYINDINAIIELHGMQHYERPICKNPKRTLEEEQENDKNKKDLALSNGISNYIVIDCRYSDIDYIKKNIYQSKLSSIYELKNIDWNVVLYNSEKSFLVKACELWNNGIHSTSYIGILLKKDRTTIHKYLSKGAKISICNYDSKTSVKLSREFRDNIKRIFSNNEDIGEIKANVFFNANSNLQKNIEQILFEKHGIVLG